MNNIAKFVLACLVALMPIFGFAQDKGSYVLGPEDVITVNVVGQPVFSGEYLVPESGEITLPVVGKVNVNGMTIDRLTQRATDGMKARLRRPEVIVTLKVARPRRVSVFGDVRAPGVFDLKAGWRISEALSAAGGLNPGVLLRDVTVHLERGATKERSSRPLGVILDEAVEKQVILGPGDTVRFEVAQPIVVQVSGRVKSPGQFRIRSEEASVLGVLSLAGGPQDDANLTTVKIIRADGSEKSLDLTPVLVRGQSVPLPSLESGDTLLVSASTDRFVVLGNVRSPGYYPLPSGRQMTLAEAVSASGGATNARLSRVGLMRNVEGKTERQVYDLGKFLNTGDAAQNPTIRSGDVIFVPESNRVDLSRALQSVAAATLVFTRIFP